jgi:hypothetical protein
MKKGETRGTVIQDILRLLKEKFQENKSSLEIRYNVEGGKIKHFASIWVYYRDMEADGCKWSLHCATLEKCRKVLGGL